ncbi:MAG: hypothetical protein EB037_11945, partial [Actinobacteria bacterium]|nr:hypothetical protein [Actinomycetota bacterium]
MIDNTAPAVTSVTASADGTYIIGQTVLIDVVFDDTVTVNTTNGTPTLLLETGTTDRNASYVSGSGTTTLRFSYTVQDGDLSTDLSYVSTSSLSANGGTMTDVNGNTATLALPTIGFPASLQARSAVVVRGQRITASAVYSPATNPTNAASVSYAFSFSSAPTGLESSDFTFGGTATGCIATVSGAVTSSASVIVSGCSDGTVILKLPAGSMSDSFGNTAPGTEYSAPSVTIDRTGPVPTFTAPSTPTIATTLTYTVAFNETMSGLVASDFQVTGTATGCVVGTPSASSGTSVTVSLTSCSAGTVILTLKAGMVNDSLGNTGPAAAVSATTVTRDVTVPSVSSFTPNTTPTNASSPTFTLTFSESITGLSDTDFTIGGTATGCSVNPPASSGTTITVTTSGCSAGTVTLTLRALMVSDLAGNSGPTIASVSSTLTIDRTAPSASASPTLASGSDAGVSASDSKTNLTTVTVTVPPASAATTRTDGVTSDVTPS